MPHSTKRAKSAVRMHYRFYTKTETAWRGMREAVDQAKQSIYFESFILAHDKLTHALFNALQQRAVAGVTVKIIADAVGSFWLSRDTLNGLKHSGIEVLTFRRLLYRNHRKILVIDGKLAFIGGANVDGKYANWLDLHLKTSNKRLVRHIVNSFAKVYERAGGKDESVLQWKRKPWTAARSSRTKQWFIEHWPIRGKSALSDYYRAACAAANNRITIVTPYFIPNRWLVKSLLSAAQRGVSIEVILPIKADWWFANIANHAFAKELEKHIRFYFTTKMIHAKVLIIDNREGLIGSNNIDAQSFDFNLEASIRFQRRDMVGDLRRIVSEWKRHALPAETARKTLPRYYRILAPIITFFRPVL